MNLNILKLILLLIMVACTLVAGLLPMKLLRYLRQSAARASSSQQHKHVSLVLCLLTCFSGGVFLATCFLHLFPELQENVRTLEMTYKIHVDYPLAELLSCLGFFLLFFLEEMVIIAIPSMVHSHSHGGHAHHEEAPLPENGCCMTGSYIMPPMNSDQNQSLKKTETTDETHDSLLDNSRRDTTSDEEVAGHCQKHCPLTVHHVRANSVHRESPECTASTEIFTALAVAEPERCETNCATVDEDPPILMKSSPHAHSHGVRSVTLVLALSIHSVIEGIAFGVGSSASETTALFVSLLVHKLIVAFSVGLQLARTHAHQLRWVVASIFILALMSPLGALIGMAVQSATSDSLGKDITIAILEGLAVGTFIYVTFFEVLLHERDNEHPNLLKLLVMVIGFGLIGMIRLVEQEHNHGGMSSSNETLVLEHGHELHEHFGHSH